MKDQNINQIIKRINKLEKTVEELRRVVFGSSKEAKQLTEHKATQISFSLNIRAFINRYAADKSRPKKFVLLLAYLAKGEIGKNIEIGKHHRIIAIDDRLKRQ